MKDSSTEPDDDLASASELLPLVYDELKRLAAFRMSGEVAGHTLQPTALVHEAYLRLTTTGEISRWENRKHFFCAAGEAMRRILIDSARRRQRLKRGGDRQRTEMNESQIMAPAKDEALLAIDEALGRFAEIDAEGAELVKMRFFMGMTLAEIAEATGASLRTVNRQWAYAKAWLRSEVAEDL